MRINGTPIPGKFPRKRMTWASGGGGGKRGGCLPALVGAAVLGGGWLSMLLTSWRSA